MEIETMSSEIIVPATPATGGSSDGATFGTRPSTGRPHSLSLFANQGNGARTVISRGADLLLGVGIGAALMYYLDRERGARRRSALGAALEDLAATVLAGVSRESARR